MGDTRNGAAAARRAAGLILLVIDRENIVDLLLVIDDKIHLSRLLQRGELVKFQSKGPIEQSGQPLGKVLILGDDADLILGEGIAIEQNAIAFCCAAAFFCRQGPAKLFPDF